MPKKKATIFAKPDLMMEKRRLDFKDFLEQLYGTRWGTIKAFIDERGLVAARVYRQLNGTDDLSDELVKEMDAFVKDNS